MKEFSILSKKQHIFLLFLIISLSFQHSYAQTTCYETAALPTDSKWGGGDAVGSNLIGNTYGAGQGPGIYIVADGGYRLYLNGELLAYDNAAGRVRFIPMTFLPRKNVISIVGVNGLNAPGVLMHLDELEKPYVSGIGWKASNAPTDNTWKTKAYSDASWANASVQSTGSITQTPSGLTITGFPTTSTAKWIWSSSNADKNVVLRYTFDIKAVGFGANTTGGDGGTVVVVNNVADLLAQIASTSAKTILIKEGSYDLRNYRDQQTCRVECNSTLPTYKGDFIDVGAGCPTNYRTIKRWEKLIWMSSNKSIIGMGRGVSLRGASFYANGGNPQKNLIFRNLKIWDVNPHIVEANDGISLNDVTKLWVDHCSFKWISDGNDIANTKECTFSWNRWNGYNQYMCSGVDNYSAMITGSDITFDHQWWDGSNGRAPKTYGDTPTRIHMINNYHSDNGYYATNSGSPTCLVYVENTHYDKIRFPTVKEHGGVIYCSGNKYDNIGSHSIDWVNSSEPKDAAAKFTVPYAYTLESVNTVKTTCMSQSGTGGKWGTMPLYTEAAELSKVNPIVSISSPTTGTNFASSTPITITASASDADGSITKVEFYSGTIKLGEDASAPYTYALSTLTTCSYSLLAVATDNNGNKTMSWPVTISVSSTPKKYIYIYDNSGNLSWSNTNSWTPKAVPTAIDTVIIRTGEVQIADLNHTGVLYVETNGTLRLIDTSSIVDLRLQGGTLKAYTSSPGMMLTSNITVEQPSTIMAGSVAATVFTLNGTIKGNSNLTKTSVGTLRINSNASSYKGNWIITEGKLQLRSATGLGVCGVQVKNSARLDIEVAAASTYSLALDNTAGVDLDQDLNVNVAVFGTNNIVAGTHKNANTPSFIGSTGSLNVSNGLVSLSGSTTFCAGSNVTLTSSSGASYIWKNNSTQVGTAAAYTANTAGSFYVDVTNSNGCKVTSAPVITTISTAPTPTVTSSATSFCAGGSAMLTASTGASYKWYNGTTSVGTNATYTATTAGSYTVEVTNASGCKATSAPTQITVSSAPVWYQDTDGDGKGNAAVSLTACTQPSGYVSTAGDECPADPNKVLAGNCGCGNAETDTDSDGTPDCTDTDDDNDGTADSNDCAPLNASIGAQKTWYADIDGDGLGEATATLTACTKPAGYVATAGDACPADPNKTLAGNCGCGNTETSCLDCAGTPNGTAFLDNCSICVGGITGNTACVTTATINGTSANISVVPQPFDANTTITIQHLGMIQSFTIISSSGTLVETKQGLNTEEITVGEDLAAGLYSVIITTEKGIYTTKIVKK